MRPTPLPAELLRHPFTLAQLRAAGLPDRVARGASRCSPARCTCSACALGPVFVPQIGLRPGIRKPAVRGIDWHPYRRVPSLISAGGGADGPTLRRSSTLAAWHRLVDVVVTGDALARRGLVTRERLVDAAAGVRGQAGLRASRAARLVRPRVDSPMETLLRLLIVFAGLPEQKTNRDVYAAAGFWLARPDLSWPRVRVSVGYDGVHHFATGEQRRSDNRRRTRMSDAGWHEIVVMSEDVYCDPWRLLHRIRGVLAQRGLPGVPERLDRAWRELV